VETVRFLATSSVLADQTGEDKSDPHRHNDVSIARRLVADRTQLPRGLFVLQLEADRAFGRGCKKVQQILGVKANRDRFALEFLFDDFFRLTVLRTGRRNLETFGRHHEFHGVGPLIRQLRYTAKRRLELGFFENECLVRVTR